MHTRWFPVNHHLQICVYCVCIRKNGNLSWFSLKCCDCDYNVKRFCWTNSNPFPPLKAFSDIFFHVHWTWAVEATVQVCTVLATAPPTSDATFWCLSSKSGIHPPSLQCLAMDSSFEKCPGRRHQLARSTGVLSSYPCGHVHIQHLKDGIRYWPGIRG